MNKHLRYTKLITTTIVSISLGFLYSCTTSKYAYTPSTANLLQLEQKGDFKAAINYSTASAPASGERRKSSNGVDLQTAYAMSKKIVIKVDAYTKAERNETTAGQNGVANEAIKYKKKGIELSLGCRNFSNSKDRTPFQAFAGAGTGNFSFTGRYNNGDPNNHHSMDYFKTFIQPSYTFFVSKNYDLTLAGKINMLQFYNVATDYPDLSATPLGNIDTKPNYYLDFVMQHQFGFKELAGLQFQVQLGITSLATSFSSAQHNFENEKYDYNNVWFAAGFILDPRKLGKKN